VVTIEHDNLVPPDGLVKLLARMEAHPEIDAISGLYFTKGPGGVAQVWGDIRDKQLNFRPQKPALDGSLVECKGIGMGFSAFRLSMFKDERIERPWFRTVTNKDEGAFSQDLMFWKNANKYGHRCAVDCSVKVGHLDSTNNELW
jgi:hypothetical protein